MKAERTSATFVKDGVPTYSALAFAVTAGDARHGALLMAGFGLGTLPAMLATGVLAQRVSGLGRVVASRRLAGALLIPYLAWVTFAAVLNFTIWRMNS